MYAVTKITEGEFAFHKVMRGAIDSLRNKKEEEFSMGFLLY
jgi:hypothetical protein